MFDDKCLKLEIFVDEKGKIDISSKHLHNLSLQERVAELN
jgi:hypothetical protein